MNKPPRNQPRRRNAQAGHRDENGPVWLWGAHAVRAALDNPSRKSLRLVATENAARRMALTEAEVLDGKALAGALPPGAVHQGVALLAEPLEPVALEDVIASGPRRIAVLDQVSDPHNLGAIYRSAAAFGVDALVLQTRHAPMITGVVAKAAVGAIESVREVRVVNIARALDLLKTADYFCVGLAGEGVADIEDAASGARRLALVLGAEGAGLRPAVAKACDQLARIPMEPGMESLNVSNAAAIAFYAARKASFPPR